MSKAKRFLALVLCILLAGGLTAAHAEMVTVGISLTGLIPAADGSFRTVTPEGEFRIFQNGEEVGVIAAGRETLTLNSRDRIRIEPLPQSFAPEWDLSSAYLSPELSGDGMQMIPVTITVRDEQKETPTPEPVPEATPEPEETDETEPEIPAEETPVPEIEIEVQAPEQQGTVEMPTLPPYTGVSVTPEPALPGLPDGGATGSLKVQVFFDKNGNGNQGDYEYGMSDLTIYLLSEDEEALTAAVTDGDGFALFENVPEGNYRTRITLPENWYFTPFGGENSLIRNAYNITPAGSQTSGVVQVVAGCEGAERGDDDDSLLLGHHIALEFHVAAQFPGYPDGGMLVTYDHGSHSGIHMSVF